MSKDDWSATDRAAIDRGAAGTLHGQHLPKVSRGAGALPPGTYTARRGGCLGCLSVVSMLSCAALVLVKAVRR